jgi:cyclopropane fatty-acyl-phospholipid synthase-like methyltransferase
MEFLKTPKLWDKWFDEVEDIAAYQWIDIQEYLNFTKGHTVEIAAGGGRFTKFLIEESESVTAVDLNEYAIERLKNRFEDITVIQNDGKSLKGVKKADYVFSFDSMVHFPKDVVFAYLKEIYRILKPNGTAFLHVSNLNEADEDITKNAHWRAEGSAYIFADKAKEIGFSEVNVKLWDWEIENLDCFLMLKK